MTNDLTTSTVNIINLVYEIRGHKVMFDKDLAMLYQVETKRLNEAVKRNINRFPPDFMFQLTQSEFSDLRSQIATSNRGGQRYMPYVFTEQGISMLSSVLNSEQAIAINIQIMRVFVKMKQFALEHKDLAERISELEQYFIKYARENNTEIERINDAINYLLDVTKPAQIGFKT